LFAARTWIAAGDEWIAFPQEGARPGQIQLVGISMTTGRRLWTYADGSVQALAASGELLLVLPARTSPNSPPPRLVVLAGKSGVERAVLDLPPTSGYVGLAAFGDRAYLTTTARELICVDVVARAVLWTWKAPGPHGESLYRVLRGDDRIFVLDEMRAYAIRDDGQLIWMAPIDTTIRCVPEFSYLHDHRLLIGGEGGGLALDDASGTVVWERRDLPGIIRQAGIAAPEGLYLFATECQLIALAVNDGTTRLSRPIPTVGPPSSLTSLVATHGLVFMYPLEADRAWHLHGLPLGEGRTGARDPVAFDVGRSILSNGDLILAFGIKELRAYKLPAHGNR
jgi:outer membrane protein assembly factor BamB